MLDYKERLKKGCALLEIGIVTCIIMMLASIAAPAVVKVKHSVKARKLGITLKEYKAKLDSTIKAAKDAKANIIKYYEFRSDFEKACKNY